MSCLIWMLLACALHEIPLVSSTTICRFESNDSIVAIRDDNCPKSSKPYYSQQLTVFDTWWEWTETAGHKNNTPLNKTLTMKALNDMVTSEFRIFRFYGSLWNQSMLIWKNNQTYYWYMYDQYYQFIQTVKPYIYAIPKLSNNQWIYLTNNNETTADFITNSTSQSRLLFYQYLKEYITRYKDNKNILFWEIGSADYSQLVDRPNETVGDTFNTEQYVEYLSQVSQYIRSYDNTRPISSGNACPPPNAWHKYYDNGSNVSDTQTQWSYMLSWQNKPLDIISCHNYGTKYYFNQSQFSMEIYYLANQVARNESKMMYVGEFGPPNVGSQYYSNQTANEFVYDTINAQVDIQDKWMLSTIFAWEDYSHGNYLLYPGRNTSVPIIDAMQKANHKMN
eukprot:193713_1